VPCRLSAPPQRRITMGGEEEAPRPAEGDAEKSKGRTGGLYMPPAKMKAMMKDMKDTSSKEYQKLSWEALKKSINGLVNKVNVSNIKNIVLEIFGENIIRGRALFVRSLLKASPAAQRGGYTALDAVRPGAVSPLADSRRVETKRTDSGRSSQENASTVAPRTI